jgi:hypothetical protein
LKIPIAGRFLSDISRRWNGGVFGAQAGLFPCFLKKHRDEIIELNIAH